jgi:hypothetical protein
MNGEEMLLKTFTGLSRRATLALLLSLAVDDMKTDRTIIYPFEKK